MVQDAPHVRRPAALVEVGVREQHLTDLHALLEKELLVFGDVTRLPDRRAHLHIVHVRGTRLQPQRLKTRRDGARRDEDHLKPSVMERADPGDDAPQRGVVGTPRLLGQRMRADLHHHPAHVLQHGARPQLRFAHFFFLPSVGLLNSRTTL